MTQAVRMLLAERLINRDQYDRALLEQARLGGTIGYHLVSSGALDDRDLVRFIVQRFPVGHWPRQRLTAISPEAIAMVPPAMAKSMRVLPLDLEAGRLVLGVTDPTDGHVLKEVGHHAGATITPAVISESDMTWALELYYPEGVSTRPDPEDPIDAPLPLTTRVTREFAALGAPPGTIQREGPVSFEPEPGAVPQAAASIEDAVRAIPLINRAIPRPERTAADTRRFERPRSGSAHGGKVVITGPPIKIGGDERPVYDSWSNQAPARNGITTYSMTAKKRGSEPPPSDDTRPGSKPGLPRRRTEGEIIAAMNSAYDRDALVALALEHLMRFAKRAAFLVVRKNEIRGFDIIGDLTSKEAARSFWIPLTTPSSLARVAHDKQIHLGPIGRSPADSVLSAALGGRPDRALILPIVIQDRTVGLLYADRIDVDVPPWSRLERLAETMADNLAKVMRRGKKR